MENITNLILIEHRCLVDEGEFVFRITWDECRFANTSVTNKDNINGAFSYSTISICHYFIIINILNFRHTWKINLIKWASTLLQNSSLLQQVKQTLLRASVTKVISKLQQLIIFSNPSLLLRQVIILPAQHLSDKRLPSDNHSRTLKQSLTHLQHKVIKQPVSSMYRLSRLSRIKLRKPLLINRTNKHLRCSNKQRIKPLGNWRQINSNSSQSKVNN